MIAAAAILRPKQGCGMTRSIRPGVVYDFNGTQYLCSKIQPEGSVYLTAVKRRYGKWACCYGPSSAAHLLYEYRATPVKHQTLAKVQLWASWNGVRRRRLRKAVSA
jgi:hypothetical protein